MKKRSSAAQAAIFFIVGVSCVQSLHAAERTYADLYSLRASATITIGPSSAPEAAAAAQVATFAIGQSTGEQDHAVVWNPAPGFAIDLNPASFFSSTAMGTDGSHQVGYGSATKISLSHALLWRGTAASAIDLNPKGYISSVAYSTSGTQQVGSGSATGSVYRALLWRGSAASAIDLTPHGFTTATADGTDGKQQIGYGYGTKTSNYDHALLWSGTAASMVDLSPTKLAGFHNSFGLGIGGSEQVGYGIAADKMHHALLWHGTGASAVDLNPVGFSVSAANGTNGVEQVGAGYGTATDGEQHALLWSGDAKSFVDLGALLPSTFISSTAFSIDANGNVFGYAQTTAGLYDAVEWQVPESASPAPEPANIALPAITALGLLGRRRKRELTAAKV